MGENNSNIKKLLGSDNNRTLSEKDFMAMFSEEANQAKSSLIRIFLKYAGKPGFVSLGGGLPDPVTFPVSDFNESWEKNIEENSSGMFQYTNTAGLDSYLNEAKSFFERDGVHIDPVKYNNDIISTVGSQLALKLVAEAFINKGDKIAVGLPTYLGALSAFKLKEPDFVGIPLDKNGLKTGDLEHKLKEMSNDGHSLKFVYVIPDFQNPAGVTMSLERRKHLLDLSENYDFLIVEDAPYRNLRYEGETIPLVYQLAQERGSNRVILMETLSKILAPGLREGLVVADKTIVDKINKLKQGTVLCNPPLSQALVAPLLKEGLEEHIEDLKDLYRRKRNRMIDALKKYMPESVTWNKPEGGFFLWLKTPYKFTPDNVVPLIEKYKVVFIPGYAFDCSGGSKSYARLNFTFPNEEEIDEGIHRLSTLIKNEV